MARPGSSCGFAAHKSIHAPLPERWTPLLQKIKDFWYLMWRRVSFKPFCTYVRTYPLIPPHCIHVRTYVRTYAYARTLQQRMFVGTYIFFISWGPPLARSPGERREIGSNGSPGPDIHPCGAPLFPTRARGKGIFGNGSTGFGWGGLRLQHFSQRGCRGK